MGPTRDQTGKQTGSTREEVWGQGAPTQPRRPGAPQPLAKESQANPEPRGTSVFPSVKWAHRLATAVGQALSPHRGQPAASPSLQKATPVPGLQLGSSGADLSYSGPMALAPSLLLLGGGQGPPGPHDGQKKPRPVPHEPVRPTAGELRGPLQRPPTAQRAPLPIPSQVPTAGQPRGARLHAWAPLASGTHGRWPPGCGLAPVGGSPPQHPSLTPPSPASRDTGGRGLLGQRAPTEPVSWPGGKGQGEQPAAQQAWLPGASAVTPEAGVGRRQAPALSSGHGPGSAALQDSLRLTTSRPSSPPANPPARRPTSVSPSLSPRRTLPQPRL